MAPLLLLQQHAFLTFVQLFAWTVTVIMFALRQTSVSVQRDGWETTACKVPSWYFYHSPGCTLLYNNIIVALCKHVNECYNGIFHSEYMAPLLLLQQHAFLTFVQLFAWTVTAIMFALRQTSVSVQRDGWEMIACKVSSWYFSHSLGCIHVM